MAGYRIYWLSRDNRIAARLEIEEAADVDAIETARSVFERERDSGYMGFEIWCLGRMVYRWIR